MTLHVHQRTEEYRELSKDLEPFIARVCADLHLTQTTEIREILQSFSAVAFLKGKEIERAERAQLQLEYLKEYLKP